MKLRSPAICNDGDLIPLQYVLEAAGGENEIPLLQWSDVPINTKGFALTCYDIDAPTGSGWWHWIVVNLPLACTSTSEFLQPIDEKFLSNGAEQVINDNGFLKYGGPCPPIGHGLHRYIFTIYALNTARLVIPESSQHAKARFFIHAHTIEQASLMGRFGR